MEGTDVVVQPSWLGRVEIGEPGSLMTSSAPGAGQVISRTRYAWRPGPELEARLPRGFRLDIDGLTGPDGTRRFRPAEAFGTFVVEASLGGLARLYDLNAESISSYDTMRLIFQQAPHLREHLARAFARPSELLVTGSERAGHFGADILPDRVGMGPEGNHGRWSVDELIRRGHAELAAGGGHVSGPGACIAAGLHAAARLDPLDPAGLSEADALTHARLALFDLGPAPGGVGPAVKEIVTDRLLALLEAHLADGTDDFDRFFFDEREDIVHRISKQRKAGGPIPREVVRQALLELVWDSYRYVGDCVSTQMQAFLRTLPTPPTAEERAAFEALYCKQPYLGGLPVVMLWNRFDFLRGAVVDLLADPHDGRRIGVLLRLIQFYAEMTGKRRQVDRSYSKRRPRPGEGGGVPGIRGIDGDPADRTTTTANRTFQRIADRLRREQGVACSCGDDETWGAKLVDDEDGDDVIKIRIECLGCGRSTTLDVTREDFDRAGRESGPWDNKAGGIDRNRRQWGRSTWSSCRPYFAYS